mmetsp:Transcript_17427/g.58387  ORF Transcript_17427/g.58387 Transcript_17427/m.58387 type:complete len:214 (+) Transcript_17427:216-857(+)
MRPRPSILNWHARLPTRCPASLGPGGASRGPHPAASPNWEGHSPRMIQFSRVDACHAVSKVGIVEAHVLHTGHVGTQSPRCRVELTQPFPPWSWCQAGGAHSCACSAQPCFLLTRRLDGCHARGVGNAPRRPHAFGAQASSERTARAPVAFSTRCVTPSRMSQKASRTLWFTSLGGSQPPRSTAPMIVTRQRPVAASTGRTMQPPPAMLRPRV